MTTQYLPLEVQILDLAHQAVSSISLLDYGFEGEVQYFRRPITATDPNISLGIWLASWEPLEDPSIGQIEQGVTRYTYGIATLVKTDERETGLRISAILTKKVRLALYRNEEFSVQLLSLREDEDGFPPIERPMRYKFERQAYDDSALNNGGFAFMSVSTLTVDTDTIS